MDEDDEVMGCGCIVVIAGIIAFVAIPSCIDKNTVKKDVRAGQYYTVTQTGRLAIANDTETLQLTPLPKTFLDATAAAMRKHDASRFNVANQNKQNIDDTVCDSLDGKGRLVPVNNEEEQPSVRIYSGVSTKYMVPPLPALQSYISNNPNIPGYSSPAAVLFHEYLTVARQEYINKYAYDESEPAEYISNFGVSYTKYVTKPEYKYSYDTAITNFYAAKKGALPALPWDDDSKIIAIYTPYTDQLCFNRTKESPEGESQNPFSPSENQTSLATNCVPSGTLDKSAPILKDVAMIKAALRTRDITDERVSLNGQCVSKAGVNSLAKKFANQQFLSLDECMARTGLKCAWNAETSRAKVIASFTPKLN